MANGGQHYLKILILEDDEGIRQIMCDIFKVSGYECVSMKEGQAAIEYINNNRHFDYLIFLDLLMSGMSGWEFMKQIRVFRNSIRMKLIVITGLHSSKWSTATLDADQILEKPFTVESLLEAANTFAAEIKKAA